MSVRTLLQQAVAGEEFIGAEVVVDLTNALQVAVADSIMGRTRHAFVSYLD